MRISVSIDKDIHLLLQEEMERSGENIEQTVNRVLRAELVAQEERSKQTGPISEPF